ncbi:hypothetical protein NGM10_05380 [Halorussus salilacus]|uniref:hypothetical protein n=1 Tax=Halorussus salilacus TaxID=2953750 RepID=UPI00209F48D9|nr:hypothetical protein [Halorussus salilacus]USZ69171.1 hypothetical protein NGM10_05380 [Halorussus salilacus]
MDGRRQVTTMALALLVVLAGCGGAGGPATDATETTEPTTHSTDATEQTNETSTDVTTETTTERSGRESVEVTGGNLSVDQTEVFWRVQELLDTDVRPRPVEVRNLTERKEYAPGRLPVLRYLGVENVTLDPDEPGGLATPDGKVYVHPGDGSSAEVERVLAHEFVHLIQYRASMLPWMSAIDQPRLTHDRLQTRLTLMEGGAVFVTDAYAEQYLDDQDPAERIADRYEDGSAGAKYFYARYHFGYRYVDDEIDSPTNLASVYEDGPNTTEQLLHGYAPDEEPPADLSVSVNESGTWSTTENDTMGELFARTTLQSELDAETARGAATGWGNDVLYGFTKGDEDPGFAWTLRMDSPDEADELESAATTFAEEREAGSDAAFRVERVDDETVVLLFGNPSFVESASASGSNANVTVGVSE